MIVNFIFKSGEWAFIEICVFITLNVVYICDVFLHRMVWFGLTQL